MIARRALLPLLLLLAPTVASAIPRFAARNGMECVQCHLNPSGGGIRNEYGGTVFEQVWLPMFGPDEVHSWVAGPPPPGADAPKLAPFRGNVTEFLTIGGDFRFAYINIQPELGPTPEDEPQPTNTFFQMQADLYHAVKLGSSLTLYLDVGVYTGFETWALWELLDRPDGLRLMLKVGRFLPPFGVREVEHQLSTREGIGLGGTDRDSGVELSAWWGPVTAQVAVVNGTLGDTAFDAAGKKERSAFEKAVSARVAGRAVLGPVRAQLGGSLYLSDNASATNPLFGTALPPAVGSLASEGVDELRYGGFGSVAMGRLAWIGDLVVVEDSFAADDVAAIKGYSSYQELSLVLTQGLELIGTYEFTEPDTEFLQNSTERAGLILELFPVPYTELRLMTRKTWSQTSPTGDSLDLVLFAHFFY